MNIGHLVVSCLILVHFCVTGLCCSGNKAQNLLFLQQHSKLPVPVFDVISTIVCESVIDRKNCRIHKILPEDLKMIRNAYNKISDNGKYPVAIRSSATTEDSPNGASSAAGIYTSFLNVKTFKDVCSCVRKCMESLFNGRAKKYNKSWKISGSMGVIIQRMVDASLSGAAFSVDISTGAPYIQISSSCGVGGALDGRTNANSYIISQKNFKVLKSITHKKSKATMSYRNIKTIAKEVMHLKKMYKQDVDIEFAIDKKDNIYILQIRPLRNVKSATVTDIDNNSKIITIASGVHSVAGVSHGVIKIINNFQDLVTRRKTINRNDVVVTNITDGEWMSFFMECSGIITTDGSPTSHPMLIARERNIPCVVGIPDAVGLLKKYEGRAVTVDGIRKRVYLGHVQLIEKPMSEIESLFEIVSPKICPSNAEVIAELKIKKRMHEDSDGLWLMPVNYKLSPFMLENLMNCRTISQKLLNKLGCITPINVKPSKIKIKNGYLYCEWNETPYQQLHSLDSMAIANCEKFYTLKSKCYEEYIKTCKSFWCSKKKFQQFCDALETLNAFMYIAYQVNTYINHKTYELANASGIPYFFLEEFLKFCENSIFDEDRIMKHEALMMSPSVKKYGSLNEIKRKNIALYKKIVNFSTKYKLTDSEDWSNNKPVNEAFRIIKEQQNSGVEQIMQPQDVVIEYFPEDKEFRRWAKLAILSKHQQNDGHHIRPRGLWIVATKLLKFGEKLVALGKLSSKHEMLGLKAKEIMEKFSDSNSQ